MSYCYDTNEIIAEPLKDITGKEILRDYNKVHDVLDNSGSKPETNWMENEASEALKKIDRQQSVAFQLVPPTHSQEKCSGASHTHLEE